MRSLWILALVLVTAGPAEAVCTLSWSGVLVGTTTKKEVQKLHGRPLTEQSSCLAYENPKIFPGTSQVKFCFTDKDVLEKVDVFPAVDLDVANIILIFGTGYQKKTLRTGQVVYLYRDVGLVVFLEEDQEKVMSLRYQPVRLEESEATPAK